MNIGIIPNKEFLSVTEEKNIFFYYYNFMEINSYSYNYDNIIKNYILNYNLYHFYSYFFSFILSKTKCNNNNIRISLLKQRLLNRLNTRVLFFYNRMIQSNPQNLNSKNNNILGCI